MTEPLIDDEHAESTDAPTGTSGQSPDDPEAAGAADGSSDAGAGPDATVADLDASRTASGDDEVEDLQTEFDGLNDRHLRLVAEFNNFRRRTDQERLSAWSRAQADLVGRFLDVVDDLQRVADLDLSNATVEAIMEGIDLVDRKVLRVLEDAGVTTLDPTDQPFDPEMMEAMMRVPAESDEQVDMVAQVFQKGYQLKGILVRPARVSVFTRG